MTKKLDKGKRIKPITFDEWTTLFTLVRELSVMLFELEARVNNLETKGEKNEK
tara:strand:- start:135 stop:293 length:159 start_codon:yes stop_codon:yes gene_type:complete